MYKQIYCIIIYERIQQQKKCLAVGKWLNKPCYIKIRDTRLYIFEITKLMHGKIIIVVGLNDGTISGFFFYSIGFKYYFLNYKICFCRKNKYK